MAPTIEEYNQYLIGLKLTPNLPLDSLMKEIKGILASHDYTVPPEQPTGLQIKFGLPIESLGLKNNVEVKLNLQSQSFNIIGENPNDVKSIFEEFLSLLSLKYPELEDIIPLYEIVATIGIKSGSHPIEVLNNSVEIDLSSLKEFSPQISILGIRLGSFKINLDGEDFIELVIEPRKGSQSNRYLTKLNFRTKEKDKIINFPLEDELIKVISSLKGE
jgi:hypothetical protein